MSTMRERLLRFTEAAIREHGPNYCVDSPTFVLAFAESEVRLALAPKQQSAELEEAARQLLDMAAEFAGEKNNAFAGDAAAVHIVLAELDRLRAENARLAAAAPAVPPQEPEGRATRTRWGVAEDAKELLAEPVGFKTFATREIAEDASKTWSGWQQCDLYRITITAERADKGGKHAYPVDTPK